MSWGLPILPGYSFSDPTKSRFHIPRKLGFQNGIAVIHDDHRAIGGEAVDTEKSIHFDTEDPYVYDPSLTYGCIRKESDPIPQPHWVLYDKCTLIFKGYIKTDDALFQDKRKINLIYFLEDDTLTVVEPYIKNSGLRQGKIVKRNKIPKNESGEYWHWKDFNIGKDVNIFGHVYHLTSCDDFTKDFMESQGILLFDGEEEISQISETPPTMLVSQNRKKDVIRDFDFRKFLQNDGKVLKFGAFLMDEEIGWDFSKQYQICFYLSDDTLSITESNPKHNYEITLFPTLLKRTKVPKDWKSITADTPVTHEIHLHDRSPDEFYSASDLILGKEIDILGRLFLLSDCDFFTRNYYKNYLNIDQESPVDPMLGNDKKPQTIQSAPPHIGIGNPEDTLMSCFTFHAKPPFKDLIQYNLNTNKRLRYLCEMISVYPEDSGRDFVMSYNLSDGTIRIDEMPLTNSGLRGGRFSGPSRHLIPGSSDYYNPNMFYIGSIIKINGHRFKIKGTDLYVYKYMSENATKFSTSIIDNVRQYLLMEGILGGNLEVSDEAHRERSESQMSLEDKLRNMNFNDNAYGTLPHIHTSQKQKAFDLSMPLSGLACAKALPELNDLSKVNPENPVACLTGVALPLREYSQPQSPTINEESYENEQSAGKPTKMVTFSDQLAVNKWM